MPMFRRQYDNNIFTGNIIYNWSVPSTDWFSMLCAGHMLTVEYLLFSYLLLSLGDSIMQMLSVHSYEWKNLYLRNCTFFQVREYEMVVFSENISTFIFLYTACSKLIDVLLKLVTKYAAAAKKKKKWKLNSLVNKCPSLFSRINTDDIRFLVLFDQQPKTQRCLLNCNVRQEKSLKL